MCVVFLILYSRIHETDISIFSFLSGLCESCESPTAAGHHASAPSSLHSSPRLPLTWYLQVHARTHLATHDVIIRRASRRTAHCWCEESGRRSRPWFGGVGACYTHIWPRCGLCATGEAAIQSFLALCHCPSCRSNDGDSDRGGQGRRWWCRGAGSAVRRVR